MRERGLYRRGAAVILGGTVALIVIAVLVYALT